MIKNATKTKNGTPAKWLGQVGDLHVFEFHSPGVGNVYSVVDDRGEPAGFGDTPIALPEPKKHYMVTYDSLFFGGPEKCIKGLYNDKITSELVARSLMQLNADNVKITEIEL